MTSSADRAPPGRRFVAAESPPRAMGSMPACKRELAILFERHAGFVFRVLERLGTPAADVEDALQEVFLVVARKLSDYEERGELRAWLFTIARQISQHSRRASARRQRRQQSVLSFGEDGNPHATLERSRAAQFVNQFLAELDPKQSDVFYLAEIEGFTAPEIAAALEIKLNTVYARLRLARERFERALQRRADSGSA